MATEQQQESAPGHRYFGWVNGVRAGSIEAPKGFGTMNAALVFFARSVDEGWTRARDIVGEGLLPPRAPRIRVTSSEGDYGEWEIGLTIEEPKQAQAPRGLGW